MSRDPIRPHTAATAAPSCTPWTDRTFLESGWYHRAEGAVRTLGSSHWSGIRFEMPHAESECLLDKPIPLPNRSAYKPVTCGRHDQPEVTPKARALSQPGR